MVKAGIGNLYLKEKFPKINDSEIKEVISVRPPIQELMKSFPVCEQRFNSLEKLAWICFKNGVHDFLGKNEAEDYKR